MDDQRVGRAIWLAVEGHVKRIGNRLFEVLSQAGKDAYQVNLAEPTCTCPDRAKGNLCKHIIACMLS